jgi:GT2 family glycosyltransferase
LTDANGHIAITAHPFESLASVICSRFGGALAPVALRRVFCSTRRRQAYDSCRRHRGPTTVDWLSGACLAVRAGLLHDIGGLDERYFLYYEDEELCLQAARRGAAVVHLPRLAAVHIGGASSDEASATWSHLYRSMLIFFARHRRSTYQAIRVVILLRAVVGLGLAAVRLPSQPKAATARARAWLDVARLVLTTRHREREGQRV